jgi:hypothetical protein
MIWQTPTISLGIISVLVAGVLSQGAFLSDYLGGWLKFVAVLFAFWIALVGTIQLYKHRFFQKARIRDLKSIAETLKDEFHIKPFRDIAYFTSDFPQSYFSLEPIDQLSAYHWLLALMLVVTVSLGYSTIVLFPPVFGIAPNSISGFSATPTANFVATLLGVVLAFALSWLGRSWLNHNTRIRLRADLRNELRECKNRLDDPLVKRIETQTLHVWELAIHSGDARFLKPRERNQIAAKYCAINNYNYEAELVRAFGEQYRQAEGMPDEAPKHKLWVERSSQIQEMRKNLAADIAAFVQNSDIWD